LRKRRRFIVMTRLAQLTQAKDSDHGTAAVDGQ
jgi:hypothetical protein